MKPILAFLGGLLSCTYCVSVSAGDKAVRRAELIDFQQERGEAAAAASSLFADVPIGPGIEAPILVPIWMRAGQSSNRFEKLTFNLPTIGNCPPKPYRSSGLLGRTAEERRRLLYPLVQRTACDAGLPIGLMDALLIQESRYNPMALSPKGAFGLGQLMPDTAKELGVNRYSLQGNLSGAARYLSWQLREFGRVDLALAAYNAGPGRVRSLRRVPRIVETQNYVDSILTNWRVIESRHLRLKQANGALPAVRTIWFADFQRRTEVRASQ